MFVFYGFNKVIFKSETVCGDAYGLKEPRPHEDGGKYGARIVSRIYQSGQSMKTKTQITAHHKGWLEFKERIPC